LTNTKKDTKMIRYSTQPSQDSNALTDSPTSPIMTTRDNQGLNDGGKPSQQDRDLQDLDAEDVNDN